MQLKSIFAPFFDGSQSYLIGIETDRDAGHGLACLPLNRTLLELKLLNLYALVNDSELSIVPYWN